MTSPLENIGNSDEPERAKEHSVPVHIEQKLRLALRNVIDGMPDAIRLGKLRERVESGEIKNVYDGVWVAMCYEEQTSMDIDQPCITATDTRGGAILLTLEELQELGALEYMDPSGQTIVIDDTSMEAAHAATLVVFPEEIGGL